MAVCSRHVQLCYYLTRAQRQEREVLTSYLSRSSMAATAEKREEHAGDSNAPAPLMSSARPLTAFWVDTCSGLKVHACNGHEDE